MNAKEWCYLALAIGLFLFSLFMVWVAWKQEKAKSPEQKALELHKKEVAQRAFRIHQQRLYRICGNITP